MATRKLLALFVLLGITLSNMHVAAVLPSAQLLAMNDLCSLLESTMGWNCSDNPCSWQFVSCNEAETSVTHLLNGTGVPTASVNANIPSSIADLVDLVELNMKSLGWTGPIPGGLLTLEQLSILDLSGNSLTGVLGTLQNPNLTLLNVGSNELAGNFPDLDQVPLLRTLVLSGNNLSGQIPSDAFSPVPSLDHFESVGTQFSGHVEAFTNRTWVVLLLTGNNLELCPSPSSSIFATTVCDFSTQGTCSGFCVSAWTNCQTTTSDVTCIPPTSPSEPPTDMPIPTVLPLAHCWTVGNSSDEVFALFGYEAQGSVNSALLDLNVTNGVLDAYPEVFLAGDHAISIRVKVTNTSHLVRLGFGLGETESVDPSNDNSQCPNATFTFIVNYPNTTNVSNIAAAVRNLYSSFIPYPFDLLTTRDYNAKREPGEVEVTMQPGQGANPMLAASELFSQPLPQTSETGTSSGPARVVTDIPTEGGTPSVEKSPDAGPSPPPGLTAQAKGAIGISIAVGLLIILIALLLVISPKAQKLPIVSKLEHDKSGRQIKPKKKGKHGSSEQALVADPASAEVNEDVVETQESKSRRVKRRKNEVQDSSEENSGSDAEDISTSSTN